MSCCYTAKGGKGPGRVWFRPASQPSAPNICLLHARVDGQARGIAAGGIPTGEFDWLRKKYGDNYNNRK